MQVTTEVTTDFPIESWADAHNLVIEVKERDPRNVISLKVAPFYASARKVEIVGDGFLSSVHGNGETPEEAVLDYQAQLSGQLVQINYDYRVKVPVFDA